MTGQQETKRPPVVALWLRNRGAEDLRESHGGKANRWTVQELACGQGRQAGEEQALFKGTHSETNTPSRDMAGG